MYRTAEVWESVAILYGQKAPIAEVTRPKCGLRTDSSVKFRLSTVETAGGWK
jgi:hypothetical protein